MEAESSPLQNTKSLIREYYRDRDLLVTDVHRREIAFQHQGQIGPDDRHNSYQSLKELLERAHRAAPLGIFSSTAYYLDPNEREFKKKAIMGYDLVFDIDVKIEGIDELTTLTIAADNTKHLVENILMKDFGFSLDDMVIDFSGRKGFHVTLRGDAYRYLESADRRQLAEYITGKHLDKKMLFPMKRGYIVSPATSYGWVGKGRKMIESILEKPQEEVYDYLIELGFAKSRAKKISSLLENPSNREAILKGRLVGFDSKALNDLSRATILQSGKQLNMILDIPVTSDKHRIFRIPGSIHGGSGLPCMEVTLDDLTDVKSILSKAADMVGRDPVKVEIKKALTLNLDQRFEIESGVVTLPRYAALAALCR